MSAALPFVRISAFYACYFGAIGVLLPYLGLYLRHSGYSAIAIGQLMAVLMAMRILAPGLWAWWADATGWRTVLMRSAAIAAPLMFLGVIRGDSFAGLAVALPVRAGVFATVVEEARVVVARLQRPQLFVDPEAYPQAGS